VIRTSQQGTQRIDLKLDDAGLNPLPTRRRIPLCFQVRVLPSSLISFNGLRQTWRTTLTVVDALAIQEQYAARTAAVSDRRIVAFDRVLELVVGNVGDANRNSRLLGTHSRSE
jgi:hypothetical protein